MYIRTTFVLATVLLTATGCGDGRALGGEDAAGDALTAVPTRIATAGRYTWEGGVPWTVRQELRIGSLAGGGADQFGMPAAIEEHVHGGFYVLDAQAGEVRLFDDSGRHVRSFGRPGGGPGEFAQAVGLARDTDGVLWIVDPGNVRLTAVDVTGTLVQIVPRVSPFMMMPWPGRVDQEGLIYDVTHGGEVGEITLLRYRPGDARVDTLPLPSYVPASFLLERQGATTRAYVPYAPQLVWAIGPQGHLWSGISDSYRLEVRDHTGRVERIVEKRSAPVRVTPEERASAIEDLRFFTDQGGVIEPGRIPRNKPAFTSIRIDDLGYAWVSPSQAAGDGQRVFDVFDPTGEFVGRVDVPIPPHQPEMLPVVIRGDRIYAAGLDESGVPYVARFRIEGRRLPAAEG